MKPVSNRIITACLLSHHAKTTVIQVYTPTEGAGEHEKDAFYDQLDNVLRDVHTHDVIILMGDFNAQINGEGRGWEDVIGPHGSSQIKETTTAAADEVIGQRRGTHRERWIQERSWNLIDERKRAKQHRDQAETAEAKRETVEAYRDLDRKVKRSCRADKKAWVEKKGEKAQKAANKNDTKTL
ncbi:uncharacterized protein LOC135693561 [Rhopilema esculentum]|uniref:uncharacterized protein LOC135693561 n=1 Tax=Rhopilema esculentum TaxID=499914 RepID=UPI0031D7E5AF|eukprot:gene10140-18806_t